MSWFLYHLTAAAHQQVYSQRSACLRGNVAEGARRNLSSVYEGHHLGAYKSGGGIIVGEYALLLHAAESPGEISYRRGLVSS